MLWGWAEPCVEATDKLSRMKQWEEAICEETNKEGQLNDKIH
jgi:hypothetical protein